MKRRIAVPELRWPDLSLVTRYYVVEDETGRLGIGWADAKNSEDGVIWAMPIHPVLPDAGLFPGNAILLAATPWHWDDRYGYIGHWCDDSYPSHISREDYGTLMRRLTIVSDLGYLIPDRWAEQALAGSNRPGYWDYGAHLGKVGGKPPVPGLQPGEMTADEAEQYTAEVGSPVSARGIRFAARNGYIPGAHKLGRDWIIPYDGLNHYLDNRPKRGRKA